MELPAGPDFASVSANFRWSIPETYSIAADCCDRWAATDPDRVALTELDEAGHRRDATYREVADLSNRLANAFVALGVTRGDRIAIVFPQSLVLAVAHLATYKLGAVAVPMTVLFGADALEHRIVDSGASIVVTDPERLARIKPIREKLADVRHIICTEPHEGALALPKVLERAASSFRTVEVSRDDPAMMIYTSGTTGPAKGVLHAHRVLPGHFPGIQVPHEGLPQPGDRFWTPADWAWAGGLLNALLPSLRFGVPILAFRFDRFDPERALDLMARENVRNTFLPPTALRLMKTVDGADAWKRLQLRTVCSAGEALGAETCDWATGAFQVSVNEAYGQTECNLVVGSSRALGAVKPGATGRALPGHEVAVVDGDGQELPPDTPGEIAVKAGDPVMFLEYWNRPQATEDKYNNGWLLTGDSGRMDEDGYIHFIGRADDIITSSGYRIGPAEIEDCLSRHPSVALSAVVGKPDPMRTEIVKAFIKLTPGTTASDELTAEIKSHVRSNLSPHEYPREIEFVDEIPLTTTGKVIRRIFRDQ